MNKTYATYVYSCSMFRGANLGHLIELRSSILGQAKRSFVSAFVFTLLQIH